MSGYGEQGNGQWSTQYPPVVPSTQHTTSQHHHMPPPPLYPQHPTQNPYPPSSSHSQYQDIYPPFTTYPSHPPSPPHFPGHQAASAYSHAATTSAPHAYSQLHPSQSLSSSHSLERRSITFRFSTSNAAIYNSRIYDSYGKSPFDVTSRGQKTTFQSSDGRPIAVIHWDYAHPIMVYRGSKFKCMDWFPYNKDKQCVSWPFFLTLLRWPSRVLPSLPFCGAKQYHRSRTITHAGKQYYTTDRDSTVYVRSSLRAHQLVTLNLF